jgi:hypothetical protein
MKLTVVNAQDECDFSQEHADGSFLDHLHFCHDYWFSLVFSF